MSSEEPTEDEVKEASKRTDLGTEKGRLAFIKVLNARMPKKRLIAQGILRTDGDRIALCELTYKTDWDLPGGIVDPDESPADCVEREVHEELGLDLRVQGLLAVNWLPPYRGWDDALLCLFDLGHVPEDTLERAVLQPREITAVHWADQATIAEHTAGYTAEMLAGVALDGREDTAFLENSARRDGM
ncbi:NUDIX domain-containing protein [Janibacter cremeus]|uniref:8-oxo-dGTP pyrophosphatase MutT (NUDIX family) n=1 Tax=Janibacter cremeus TaxID=1285192 RepID=A0A852VKD7_9MICO|nr:NUDIX hydrolase [Janibacter cremeus]NYF97567.1 8-oxo-dGTP pyrophosphatase MutT (NUDIX family) [Janibacter cremeus]